MSFNLGGVKVTGMVPLLPPPLSTYAYFGDTFEKLFVTFCCSVMVS
jgi:hypothetical protein